MASPSTRRGAFLSVLCILSGVIVILINQEQPEPYMDEIFHVPQAQNYCHGEYKHWNPMITTLPGLYLLSLPFLKIFSFFNSSITLSELCTTFNLRCTNLIFTIIYFIVIYKIVNVVSKARQNKKQVQQNNEELKDIIFMKAVNLTTFPLIFFYSFLYYTDVGSTTFVLLAYFFCLMECNILSSFSGSIAIIFRQTNVVWVGFCCATNVIMVLQRKHLLNKEDSILTTACNCMKALFSNFVELFNIVLPYAFVLLGFLIFVIKNNGIVVGDRLSHEASLNFPQMFYFSIFVISFSCYILTRYFNFTKLQILTKKMTFLKILFCFLTLCFMFFAVHYFTDVHKYLLSDNRHYPFYIWRKLYQRHWSIKYFLVPIYMGCWIIVINELQESSCNGLWILVFIFCSCAVLIPQKLLEFRYFIIPYVMFNVHVKSKSKIELLIEFLVYNSINVITFYLFLYRPFKWSSEDALQRFMW